MEKETADALKLLQTQKVVYKILPGYQESFKFTKKLKLNLSCLNNLKTKISPLQKPTPKKLIWKVVHFKKTLQITVTILISFLNTS